MEAFSKSLFWELHKKAYTKMGPSIWSKVGIPFYLTSSTFFVDRVFNIFKSAFEKWKLLRLISENDPVYIVDLGCGVGRFGYLFLEMLEKSSMKGNFLYVFLDISDKNLAFIRNHEQTSKFFNAKVADTCLFDILSDGPLFLESRGANIVSSINPMFLVSNYFLIVFRKIYFCIPKENYSKELSIVIFLGIMTKFLIG